MKNKALKWILSQIKGQRAAFALLVLSNAALSVAAVLFAVLSKSLVDCALEGDRAGLVRYIVYMSLTVLAQLLTRVLSGALTESIRGRLDMHLKNSVFAAVLKKDYGKITAYHTGELINRMFSDVSVVCSGITSVLPNAVSLLCRVAAVAAALTLFDRVFILVFIGAGAAVFFVSRFLRRRMKPLHKNMQEADGRVRSYMQEALDRLLIIKAFGVCEKSRLSALRLQKKHYSAYMKRGLLNVLSGAGFMFVFRAAYLATLIYCSVGLFRGDAAMTFGTLTALLQLVSQVQQPFISLSGILPAYYSMLASAERILQISELPDEPARDDGVLSRFAASDGIIFSDISFDYGRERVLCGASGRIKKDSFTLITGTTGAGKSTLFMLLLGVYRAQGSITLSDKTPISGGLFAYVPQGNLLFSGTVRENLCFAAEADDEKLYSALETACAADFVRALPQGLCAQIGEHGCALSEGQAQRLAIARALISGAPVLLLDEATSALDEATEERLLFNLRALSGKTLLLISHKGAARRVCDTELVLENGAFSERLKT